MSTEIVYSPVALDDLDTIWNFLAIECDSVKTANKAIDVLLGSIDKLSMLPEMGTRLDARCIIHSDYRFLLSGNYLTFYRYQEDCVFVDRILDGRSDYLRTLFGLDGSGIDLYL